MPDLCIICDSSEEAHQAGGRAHNFTPPGVRVDVSQFDRKRPMNDAPGIAEVANQNVSASISALPFDPVLRKILLGAKIITLDQIEQTERELRAQMGIPNGSE